jgi:hypothetical protein
MKRRDFLAAAAALPTLAATPHVFGHTGHRAATTNWTCSVSDGVSGPEAKLFLSRSGSAPSPFGLRGICYSPCPINNTNKNGPAIGDWFWDSFSGTGYNIGNWHKLWERDLPRIRATGANTIRVYSMISRQFLPDGRLPAPPFTDLHLFTHTAFLDMCWNGGVDPLYVLVGIPLPDSMYWLDTYKEADAPYWTSMLSETVAQVAGHPAVLGFIIQNEHDGADVCYGGNKQTEFWWGQVEKMGGLVKKAMGQNKKLVGMATHDDPLIPGRAESYMKEMTSLDFWGVNNYQVYDFDAIFKRSGNGPGYDDMSGVARKPVILTEWGMPATSHRNPDDIYSIYADQATIQKSAEAITRVVPQAFNGKYPLSLGLYYFEYCDERWNQPECKDNYRWCGGTRNAGFPNGYWDQHGFGLYSTARGGNLPDNAPTWEQSGGYGHPTTPIDVVTPRDAMISALRAAFHS